MCYKSCVLDSPIIITNYGILNTAEKNNYEEM